MSRRRENDMPVSRGVRYTKLHVLSSDEEDNVEFDQEMVKLVDSQEQQYQEIPNDSVNDDPAHEKYFTVEEGVESLQFGFFQIRLYLISGLFTAADAMEMMLLAVLSPVLRCEWQLEQFEVALITTIVFVGMCVMAPVWGYMGDQFGRQKTLGLISVWIGYFGLLTVFSPSYTWILILRGLVGGGMAGTPQSFALLTEYLPSKYRAKLLNASAVSWAFGTMFEIVVAAVTIPTLGWRWLLAFSAIPILLTVCLLKFLPESARYLVAAGKKEEAMKILKQAADLNKAKLPEGQLMSSKAEARGRPRDLFSSQYLRTTFQVWLLWFGTAFSYYGMVLASAEILQVQNADGKGEGCSCNLLTWDNYMTMIVSTVGEFIALPLNLFLIDFVGRRWTGAINLFGCSIFFLLLQLPVSPTVLTVFIFMVRGFSSGVFNFVYIYTGEVYPTTIRTLGIGAASSWARVGAMITPFVAQVLLDISLTAAVSLYGGVCLVCGICSVLLPIETKGRELPETVGMN